MHILGSTFTSPFPRLYWHGGTNEERELAGSTELAGNITIEEHGTNEEHGNSEEHGTNNTRELPRSTELKTKKQRTKGLTDNSH